jgi:ABC-type lipoprotein release transport system permease subunit
MAVEVRAELFLASRDLARNKKILAVVILALLLGITNTAVTVGLLRGFEKYFSEDVVDAFVGQVMITPPEGHTFFDNADYVVDKALLLPQVKEVSKQTELVGSLISGAREGLATSLRTEFHVIVVDAEKEREISVIPRKIKSGDFLSGESGEIVLGSTLAENLDVGVGDYLETEFLGRRISFRVVGIADTGISLIDEMYATIDMADGEKILGSKNVFNRIILKLYDKDDATAVKAALLGEGITGSVQTWDEMMGFAKDIMDMVSVMLFLVSAVAIIAASISIAVMLYINVLHHTKEIGTLRAMGASKSFIMRLYFSEGLLIGLLGIVAGVLFSSAVILYFAANPVAVQGITLRIALDIPTVIAACGVTVFCVFAASAYPAYQASKREPIEALRYE